VRVLDSQVDLFGIDNFRLFGLLVKNRVVQGFALVEDRKLILSIHADRDCGVAHGIGRALGLDLINGLMEL